MQYFRKTLALIFFLSFFLFSFLAITPKLALAEGPLEDKNPIAGMMENWPKNNPWALAKDFCDKRNGDLMNLETWYSGKCKEGTYTLSGEGVGFVDIVQLQGLEWVFRPQYKSMPEQIADMVTMLVELSNSLTAENYQKNLQKLQNAEINKGVVPQLGMIIQKLINTKPASSTEYLAYVSNNLKKNHVVTDTYAAAPGYGFQSLSPILPIWRAFRNISYMLFAIAFVLYGLMIMFRIKIDGRTAATITLAIPKLISTLLLITFSYAIVGLLVDISTIMGALLIDTLRVGKILTVPDHKLIQTVAGNTFGSIGSFAVNFITGLLITPFLVLNLLIGGLAGAVTSTLYIFLGGFGVIVTIIITIAIGWSYIQLIIKLFQSYFSIIISLIFSPLILLGSILPGSKAFSKWIMSIIGNLAVFPAASFLLVLSYALMVQPLIPIIDLIGTYVPAASGATGEGLLGVTQLTDTFSTVWTPPLTVPFNIEVLNNSPIGGNSGSPMASLMLATIGIGLLLMSSKYVDMVLKAFNIESFTFVSAIGDALKKGKPAAKSATDSIGTVAGGVGTRMQNRLNAINSIT
jgi:hypothetical protein